MIRKKILLLLFFFSGATGLGYEILWTRMLAVGLGHEIISMLAVVAGFFSGIALGAWIFDRPVSRSAVPSRWYAGFEMAIGIWAALLVLIIPVMTPVVSTLIGIEPSGIRQWSVAFVYPFLMLLPATAAMGGTLPAIDRFASQLGCSRSIAGLYSANTFGAMAGTLAVTFFFLPAIGMPCTTLLLASLNIAGAGGILLLSAGAREQRTAPVRTVEPVNGIGGLYLILFCTGMLGIGFEVVMVRVLSQILENTIFSFAALLTVFLFGTALGAALYQGQNRLPSFNRTLVFLLNGTALLCLGSVVMLRYAEQLFNLACKVFGSSFSGSVSAELFLAGIILILPAAAMGATFSHLAGHLRTGDNGVGRALCLNTIGGAVAPFLFGVWLIPALGLKTTLLLAAGGYIAIIPRFYQRTVPMTVNATLFIILIFLDPFGYRFVSLPDGDTVISYREGVMASVTVLQDREKNFHLKVNNHYQMGGTTSFYSDSRQAVLPLLLHRNPRTALFLGLGTGTTFAAAAGYPDLQADGIELIPEVIEAVPYFISAENKLQNAENLRIINADARRYVSVTEKKYDLVIADLFHPARDGAGSLYTREHFTAIRNVLNPDGLFCQWLPLYQLDLDMLKVIVRTFLEVFPKGQAYLAHYSLESPIIGLVGSRKPLRYPEKWFRTRLSDGKIRQLVLPLKYDSFYSLFGTFLAGSEQLREFSSASPINTDNFPVVLLQAPHFVYGHPAPPGERLVTLLDEFAPADPENVLTPYVTEEDYLARDRLAAYWQARNSFLLAGTRVEKTQDVKKLYQEVREPLLKVVRQSLDFSAAYFPLLSIAYEMYPIDRDASHQLLNDLVRANPMRREAYILLRKLFGESN